MSGAAWAPFTQHSCSNYFHVQFKENGWSKVKKKKLIPLNLNILKEGRKLEGRWGRAARKQVLEEVPAPAGPPPAGPTSLPVPATLPQQADTSLPHTSQPWSN